MKSKEHAVVLSEAKEFGPSETFHRRLGELSEDTVKSKNLHKCPTPAMISQILSKDNLKTRLDHNYVLECLLMSELYEAFDNEDTEIKGYIQNVMAKPFGVILFTPKQIELAVKAVKDGLTLYLDATGSVVRKLPGQKRVLFYPLLIKGAEGEPPLPIAEYVTSEHTTVSIQNYLYRVHRALVSQGGQKTVPTRVEVDFSWALIHAACHAFNVMSTAEYILQCWTVASSDDQEKKFPCVIHVCSAHFLHNLSSRLKELIKEKDTRQIVMYVVARLLEIGSLESADEIFRDCCLVFGRQNIDLDVSAATLRLEDLVNMRDDSITLEDRADNIVVHDDTKQKGLKNKSPFYGHYLTIFNEETSTDNGARANPHYAPDALQLILKKMQTLPLWSGLMLEEKTRETNSTAELWMRIVKKDILQCKTKLRPGDFIRRLYVSLKGRIRRAELYGAQMSDDEQPTKRKTKDKATKERKHRKDSRRKKTIKDTNDDDDGSKDAKKDTERRDSSRSKTRDKKDTNQSTQKTDRKDKEMKEKKQRKDSKTRKTSKDKNDDDGSKDHSKKRKGKEASSIQSSIDAVVVDGRSKSVDSGEKGRKSQQINIDNQTVKKPRDGFEFKARDDANKSTPKTDRKIQKNTEKKERNDSKTIKTIMDKNDDDGSIDHSKKRKGKEASNIQSSIDGSVDSGEKGGKSQQINKDNQTVKKRHDGFEFKAREDANKSTPKTDRKDQKNTEQKERNDSKTIKTTMDKYDDDGSEDHGNEREGKETSTIQSSTGAVVVDGRSENVGSGEKGRKSQQINKDIQTFKKRRDGFEFKAREDENQSTPKTDRKDKEVTEKKEINECKTRNTIKDKYDDGSKDYSKERKEKTSTVQSSINVVLVDGRSKPVNSGQKATKTQQNCETTKTAKKQLDSLVSKTREDANQSTPKTDRSDGIREKILDSVEKWGKKAADRGSKRQPLYFTTPRKKLKFHTDQPDDKGPLIKFDFRSFRCPPWGGKALLDGKKIKMTNTCPIDNVLLALRIIMGHHNRKELSAYRQPATNILLKVLNLFCEGHFEQGKCVWLNEVCGFSSNERSWDCWGSEYDRIVKFLDIIQLREWEGKCSSEICPRRINRRSGRPIVLSEITRNDGSIEKVSSMQELIDCWEAQIFGYCDALVSWETDKPDTQPILDESGKEIGRRDVYLCDGTRQYSQQKFKLDSPPFLFITVDGISQTLTRCGVPNTIDILGKQYFPAALTTIENRHFRAYVREPGQDWYLYDGTAGRMLKKSRKLSLKNPCYMICMRP